MPHLLTTSFIKQKLQWDEFEKENKGNNVKFNFRGTGLVKQQAMAIQQNTNNDLQEGLKAILRHSYIYNNFSMKLRLLFLFIMSTIGYVLLLIPSANLFLEVLVSVFK